MLFGFGDSFTYGALEGGRVDNNFLNILGKKLDMPVKNCAHWGFGMEDIMACVTKQLKDIKKGDVVILGGTTVDRMMFPVEYQAIKDKHGREDSDYVHSLHGINSNGIEYFFDSKQYKSIDQRYFEKTNKLKGDIVDGFVASLEEPGYYGYADKQVYVKLYVDQYKHLKQSFNQAFLNFYSDWFKNWEDYFVSRDIKFYYWTSEWWKGIPQELLGECLHWNEEGHMFFAKEAWKFMEKYFSGEIKVPRSII